MKLSGWGRYPVHDGSLAHPRDATDVSAVLARGPVVARGNGRGYGDSAIAAGGYTVSTAHLNRMLTFDPETGILEAEAGVILGDVIQAFLPLGWFPAVTPGTKFVTLGGMAAGDVHGKNHHIDGSFRNCVLWLDVMGPEGTIRRCGPDRDAELFDLTLGGMGLTGVILRLAIRLRPVQSAWIAQDTRALPDLKSTLRAFEGSNNATYSVAWIDCLAKGATMGRSILMLGEHAEASELSVKHRQAPFRIPARRRLSVSVDLPQLTLNSLTVRVFNALYYRKGAATAGRSMVDWDSYFYPLDSILGWNRIYGRRGFIQFQCVLPLESSHDGLQALLTETSRAGAGSFLAVLKKLGDQSGAFSFPMPGYTLALDFPVNRRTLSLLPRLDDIVITHGGRFNLTKDARMSADVLRRSDPRADTFRSRRGDLKLVERFASKQSERLQI